MISFQVDDMSCAHCVKSITEAVQAVDAGARVRVELGEHRVEIDAAGLQADAYLAAIEAAGFSPVTATASAPAGPVAAQPG